MMDERQQVLTETEAEGLLDAVDWMIRSGARFRVSAHPDDAGEADELCQRLTGLNRFDAENWTEFYSGAGDEVAVVFHGYRFTKGAT